MIDSANPASRRCKRLGQATHSGSCQKPFFLNAKERNALARLLQAQRDAFAEAETGFPRPPAHEPFTISDLGLLEGLFGWLNAEIAKTGCVFSEKASS